MDLGLRISTNKILHRRCFYWFNTPIYHLSYAELRGCMPFDHRRQIGRCRGAYGTTVFASFAFSGTLPTTRAAVPGKGKTARVLWLIDHMVTD